MSTPLVGGAILIVSVLGGWLARERGKPVIRFLASRNVAAMRSVVRDYLTDRMPLDSAAARLAPLVARGARYTMLLSEPLGPGSAVIEEVRLAPPGYSEDDPRILQVWKRALILSAPPQVRAQLEETLNPPRRRDSGSPGRIHT